MRKLALTVAIACLSTIAVAADSSSTGAQGRSSGTGANAAGNMSGTGSAGTSGNMGATGSAGTSGNMGATGNTTAPGTGAGKPAPKGAGDVYLSTEFWGKYAKDGYLSKEDAARFKGSDGKTVNMNLLDMDNDGRVSEREWTSYHQKAGAAGARPGGNQGQSTGNR